MTKTESRKAAEKAYDRKLMDARTKSPSPSVDEVATYAAYWHGQCQAIATILGLPEPEEGFAGVVRDHVASLVSPPKAGAGEPVGWETEAESDLEQRAFHAANRADVPEDARNTVADLWKQYCIAALANHEARGDGVRVDAFVAAVVALSATGIEADMQEVLVRGNPMRGIKPNALLNAIEAYNRAALPPLGDGRAEIVEECAKAVDALRQGRVDSGLYAAVCREAADAITNLERELEDKSDQLASLHTSRDEMEYDYNEMHDRYYDTAEALTASQAEVERLKAALTAIKRAARKNKVDPDLIYGTADDALKVSP